MALSYRFLLRAFGIGIALFLFAQGVSAQETNDLVHLINDYRGTPRTCEATRTAAAGPLAPNPALAAAQFAAASRLLQELKTRGYLGESAHLINVSGPTNARAVMEFIEPRYCRALSDPQHTEIGVRRDGRNWQIVLARRLLASDLGDWREAAGKVLRLTNAARAEARACGSKHYGPAPPLDWDAKLAAAALMHSRDMAARNYFDHVGRNGSDPARRATQVGYGWQLIGENIAAGQGSAEQVVSAWLSSPVHCVNIMDQRFTAMGAAFALNPGSEATIYWTQSFGKPP